MYGTTNTCGNVEYVIGKRILVVMVKHIVFITLQLKPNIRALQTT